MAIDGKLIARNTALNLLGLTIPLVAAVIFIPPVISILGQERFGVFSLALVILSYFTVFDFGLGRAVTKYVAAAIAQNDNAAVSRYTWTAMLTQFVFGCALTLLLLLLLPTLLTGVLRTPPHLLSETQSAFSLLAVTIPTVLLASSLTGVLEAAQRFDLVNAVRIPLNVLIYATPLIGFSLGMDLAGIIALILVSRVVGLGVLAVMAYRLFPILGKMTFQRHILSQLFIYGSWIMAGNALGPLLLYVDRFIVATFVGLSAVTIYTAPFEVVVRIQIISTSLIFALFPVFGSMAYRGSAEFHNLFLRSARYILLLASPIIILLFVFAEPLLSLWLGPTLGAQTTDVLRIFLVGSLLGLPAPLANSVLQAIGRPDILPRLYLVYSAAFFFLLWIAAKEAGILGVAACVSLRSAIDTVTLVAIVSRFTDLPLRRIANEVTKTLIVLTLFACAVASSLLLDSTFAKAMLTLLSTTAFILIVWWRVLDQHERAVFASLLRKWLVRTDIAPR